MAYKSVVSALTAQNSTETTATVVDTLTVPQGVSKVVGVGVESHAKGLTTLETVSGILALTSDDMAGWGGTQQFLMPMQNALTGGVVGLNPYIHPTDIPVSPGGHLILTATYDMALTITPSTRVQVIYE
jgi:hypothetical protein